jgi:shikimate kinase
MDDIVVATGGGAVKLAENRNHLGGRGFVIYLYTTVEQQVARTSKGRDRPLLEGGDPGRILEALLEVRDPLYRSIADLVVNTDGRKVKSVADEIIEHLA